MKRYIKGFTLIELLVVIAIIGILASVVLVSLQSARKKGNDTRVISDVQQLRTQLESDYNASTGYLTGIPTSNTFNATGVYAQLTTDAANNGGVINVVGTVASGAINAYAIYGNLPSNPTKYFCIDSTGKTNPVDSQKATVTCS